MPVAATLVRDARSKIVSRVMGSAGAPGATRRAP